MDLEKVLDDFEYRESKRAAIILVSRSNVCVLCLHRFDDIDKMLKLLCL